jgi:hypothetical protein
MAKEGFDVIECGVCDIRLIIYSIGNLLRMFLL